MPSRKRSTIEDVRAAGFTVALASGSVDVEEQALAEALAASGQEKIEADARSVADDVARLGAAKGISGQPLADLVLRATTRAVESIQRGRGEAVVFHEQALLNAQAMPDVYFVSALGDPETPDDDVQVYVTCSLDGSGWDEGAQAMLDALVENPPG